MNRLVCAASGTCILCTSAFGVVFPGQVQYLIHEISFVSFLWLRFLSAANAIWYSTWHSLLMKHEIQ